MGQSILNLKFVFSGKIPFDVDLICSYFAAKSLKR